MTKLFVAVACACCLSGIATSQVVLDGTLGQNVPLGGDANNFFVDEIHGDLRGTNLFHSFLQFDLSSTQSATFTGTSPINNVIGRVTGGPSTIGGLIRSNILGANIFLMNPAGITFTETASLDVSGSFHTTTADYLSFADGERFFAAPAAASVLSPVDVSSFGFLGAAAPVTVDQSVLFVPDGETLSFVGGDLDITGGPFGFLSASGGQIHLASVASAGEIGVNPANTNAAAFTQLGFISLSNFAFLNVAAPGLDAGSIHILGQNLDMREGAVLVADDGGRLFGFAFGGESGGLIDIDIRDLAIISGGSTIDASGTFGGQIDIQAGNFVLYGPNTTLSIFSLFDSPSAGIDILANGAGVPLLCPASICITNQSTIQSIHIDSGQGADINLLGGDVLIDGASVIRTSSLGSGVGGSINIGGNSVVVDFAGITADAQGTGNSGSIFLTGNTIELLDFASVETLAGGAGNAGDISLLSGDARISSGSIVASSTFNPFTTSRPGSITIIANNLTIDQQGAVASDSVSAGSSGDIVILVDSLTIGSDGSILSSTADPGFVALSGGPLGQGANILIGTQTANLSSGAGIQSITTGVGDAGDILVDAAQSISLIGGSGNPFDTLISSASLGAFGSAGDIFLNVPLGNLLMDDAAVISQSLNGSFGDAGDIWLTATGLDIADSVISTETDGIGNAGSLTIEGGNGSFAQTALFRNSVLGSSTRGSGSAGDMTFLVSEFTASGGRIQARSAADGDAGNILILTDRLTLQDGAFLSNANEFLLDASGAIIPSTGGGGNLTIEASEFVTVTGSVAGIHSTISNLNFDGTGERTVTIRTPVLTVENGGQIEGSTFGTGNAANFDIEVDRLVVQNGGLIANGTSGAIDLGGGLILPTSTGTGGQIDILATESVLIAGSSSVPDGTSISSSTLGLGDAGNIRIDAPLIEVRDGGVVHGFTTTAASGGSIELNTETLTVSNNGIILADSTSEVGADPALVTGQAGDIIVNASDVSLIGTDSGFTGVRAASTTSGAGGSVGITADTLLISSEAQVTARADGAGNAGNVMIDAGQITMNSGASIETRAAIGDGGNISFGAGTLLYMSDSSITTSVESGVGSGGNITVNPRTSVLDSSEIRADAFGGDGGNIDLNSRYLISTPDSQISASSQLGNAGVINVAAPDIAIVGSLTSLPADFLAAATLFRPVCEIRETDEGSSLVVVNRAGVPASPEGLLLAYDVPEPLGPVTIAGADRASDPQLSAAILATTEGSRAFNSGHFEEARTRFAMASRMYAEAGDTASLGQALRGLSEAQQANGDYEGSVATLNDVLTAAENAGDDATVAQALASLGNALIALEQPELAREHLTRGITVAMTANRPEIAAQNLNNLANLDVIQGDFEDALRQYEESAKLASTAGDKLQAGKAYANGARVALRAKSFGRARELLNNAESALRQIVHSHDKVYAFIHLARTYQRLAVSQTDRRDDFRKAYQTLDMAADIANTLQDDRALAYAKGNMAQLYEDDARYEEALVLTRQAIGAAERAEALESYYRWHWQMGRILWAAGQNLAALDAYRRAVAILQATRQETAYSYLRSETSFRDSVGPVYQDLVDRLLQVSEMAAGPNEQSRLLLEARDTVEQLKAAELREYFRDECVADLEAKAISVESVSTDAAIVYPVLFPDRLELLVSAPDGLTRYTTPVSAAMMGETIRQFRNALQQPSSQDYLAPSQQLYEWLVKPFEEHLDDLGVRTLVFVPGGGLRTIPMSALHDGRDFLVRKYAIAVTPILTLTDPQPLDRQEPSILLAGISKTVAGAPPLPYVPGELNAIQEIFGGRLLLDEGFTTENFVQGMQDRELDIVHIASHGVFTGDPDTSFLLTHDGRISMNQLSDYIGRTRFRETPLELLVLSACETAIGDDRAALGLAGVAINAGARSALGSLWAINDQATATLIEEFYRQLRNPSLSRADALRTAQLRFIDSDEQAFQHPYYWSAFLLISNWL